MRENMFFFLNFFGVFPLGLKKLEAKMRKNKIEEINKPKRCGSKIDFRNNTLILSFDNSILFQTFSVRVVGLNVFVAFDMISFVGDIILAFGLIIYAR